MLIPLWTAFLIELSWYRIYDLIAGGGDEREVALVTEATEGATTEADQGELTEGVVAEADQGGPGDTEEVAAREKKEAGVARYVGDNRTVVIAATEKCQRENVTVAKSIERSISRTQRRWRPDERNQNHDNRRERPSRTPSIPEEKKPVPRKQS